MTGTFGGRVALVAAGSVLLRLPLLDRAPSPDEAGFLMVGAQWHRGGPSLYGGFWVDRPPLLISIFRVASQLGGVVPLRLIGCLAVALLVVGAAQVARTVAGDRAGVWSALTAATFCLSPLAGGLEVDGELLSAPIVVWGMAAALSGLRQEHPRRVLLAAGAAGTALVAALLVKQNIADVGVFAATAVVVSRARSEVTTPQALRFVAAFASGALAGLVAAGAWTLLHGTSLVGVYDAMYPFRIEASRVVNAAGGTAARYRLEVLALSWVLSGGALLMVLALWGLVSRRARDTVMWALVATLAYGVVSLLAGGSYWHHYLIELVAPVAVATGVLVGRRQLGARSVVVAAVVVSAMAWAVSLPVGLTSKGSVVGRAISAVADSHDTIVTAFGHADVSETSGLSSPYPYLWRLPAKILDPHLSTLDGVLTGPHAPTWFVTWGHVSSWGLDSTATARIVATGYHPVADVNGHLVYLRNGVLRRAPRTPVTSHPQVPPVVTQLRELLMRSGLSPPARAGLPDPAQPEVRRRHPA